MRPGQFMDRPPRPPRPAPGQHGCIHLRTASYAIFNIEGGEQVQADFLQSDSEAPSFIKNKPVIPQVIPQVQSDFNQSDSTAPAYIRNKPTSYGGSSWDQGETPQDEGTAGMDWIDG